MLKPRGPFTPSYGDLGMQFPRKRSKSCVGCMLGQVPELLCLLGRFRYFSARHQGTRQPKLANALPVPIQEKSRIGWAPANSSEIVQSPIVFFQSERRKPRRNQGHSPDLARWFIRV